MIRLVLGAKVRDLVLTYLADVAFFSPVEYFDDARKYLPGLLSRRGTEPVPALEDLDHFEQLIRPLESRST